MSIPVVATGTSAPNGTIDRRDPLPLYEQVKRGILALLADGMRPGDRLPTERALCERFGVSRITVIRALDDLEQRGLLERIQGKGTILADPGRRVNKDLSRLQGFTEIMAEQGRRAHAQILSTRVVAAAPAYARAFAPAPPAATYLEVVRLRLVEGTPVVVATSVFPEPLAAGVQALLGPDLSFHQLVERVTGRRVTREAQTIKPVLVDRAEARLLRVRPRSPHFLLEGVTYVEGDQPAEFTRSIFRSDKFEFSANLSRFIP